MLVVGGCSYNAMIYLEEFTQETETHRAKNFQETVGSTGAGKTLNLGRLGMNATFHAMIGALRLRKTTTRISMRPRAKRATEMLDRSEDST